MSNSEINGVTVLSVEEKTHLASYPPYLKALGLPLPYGQAVFRVYHEKAHAILGRNPTLQCIIEDDTEPFAHEAGVYLPDLKQVWITSNRLAGGIKVGMVVENYDGSWSYKHIPDVSEKVPMANGGTNYMGGVLFCAQGSLSSKAPGIRGDEQHGGLVLYTFKTSWTRQTLLNHYLGRPFNSPNDVVVTSCGLIWFTDPTYGYEQGFRPKPSLPPQVYCFDPNTGCVRVAADGFKHPNGIAFSPDEKTCYITDTDWVWGDGSTDDTRVSTIYAMDVVPGLEGEPTLRSRRVFAMADTGIPDGIKCDIHGNVYSGCGDGLNVWSPGGTLLFKVLIPGGVANFCFMENGEVMLLNETKIWLLKLEPNCKGALLKI